MDRAGNVKAKLEKEYGVKAVVIQGVSFLASSNSNVKSISALGRRNDKDYRVKNTRQLTSEQDMGLEADCTRVVNEAIFALGGLDIIISNAVCYSPLSY